MTDQPTNCITLNSPPTEEILRLDEEGFHYKGEFIADAGEAHRLMVEFLNQTTPQPEPVERAVSDALIKAECALSDVAEGEPECNDGDPAQWAEQRCAETLAIIRPVMKLYKIRTSEWPPQLMPTPANQPVPVNERLPGVGDCDAEGFCWFWDYGWTRQKRGWHDDECTHWLPHWALPVPANNTKEEN